MKQNMITLFSLTLLFIGRSGFTQNLYYIKGDSVVQIYRFQEVVVYGNHEQIPSSLLIKIDQQQMKIRNSFTVSELLNLEPGLNFTTGYKSETETRIRAFCLSDVLVLVKGVRSIRAITAKLIFRCCRWIIWQKLPSSRD